MKRSIVLALATGSLYVGNHPIHAATVQLGNSEAIEKIYARQVCDQQGARTRDLKGSTRP